MKVRIRRYPEGLEEFKFYLRKRTTLLDLLTTIKEDLDPSLTFRSMCRSGVCGTCALKLNGKPVLACSTWVEDHEDLLVEPLDQFNVIRDLVVNHDVILKKLKENSCWLEPLEENIAYHEETNSKTFKSHECILCGICDSVCPVMPIAPFGGPLLLTRLHKHLIDIRNQGKDRAMQRVKALNPQLCTHCMNCSYACPKRLMPESLIKEEEGLLIERGLVQRQLGFDFLNF
ncbi:MAG: succinate dehydrogenase/fumarate reductase iron-sulfur subunit [Acidobacteria bacterium]|jgi:succinate dehydrogenase / fumarate reductase iron-sulfur subunit/fumarate reductase iron-sulfur subunit|nr:MAG: succinate dehydrogenase/fumarate reductase iron-sulfur subunit [Acidobacteriota bacterium]